MNQHKFTEQTAAKLQELHRIFIDLDGTDPDFNWYLLIPHGFVECKPADANSVLIASRLCTAPDCGYVGNSCWHSDNSPQFTDWKKELTAQNDLEEIMDRFPLFEAGHELPEWASSFGRGQDWGWLAVRAAVVGLEFPSLSIPVSKRILAAKPIGSPSPANSSFGIYAGSDPQPLAIADYNAATKRGLDLLSQTQVTVVTLYGLFGAAAKLAQATIAKWNKA
jgi:hypothetical protein